MTKEIIEKLLLKIQPACPKDLEFSVKEIPLSGTRVLYLLIVKDDEKFEDIDEWAIHKVYPLFYTLWRIFKDENVSGKVRFLFYNKTDFVRLLTPQFSTNLADLSIANVMATNIMCTCWARFITLII